MTKNNKNKLDYQANTTTHKGNVSLEENKMKCIFENKAKIELHKVKVDGGLLNSSANEKCDYLVHWEQKNNKIVFYVELKGCDVKKAIQQLISTINLTKDRFAQFDNKNCVIVCSRFPQQDSTMIKLKKQLKGMGYTLHTKNRLFSYTVR
ncbi:MAG: hypothetical protein KGV51_08885 [Moraxellaceae bacterium]|nr:hypothetical protein [Moraxellaceae bacterium]